MLAGGDPLRRPTIAPPDALQRQSGLQAAKFCAVFAESLWPTSELAHAQARWLAGVTGNPRKQRFVRVPSRYHLEVDMKVCRLFLIAMVLGSFAAVGCGDSARDQCKDACDGIEQEIEACRRACDAIR